MTTPPGKAVQRQAMPGPSAVSARCESRSAGQHECGSPITLALVVRSMSTTDTPAEAESVLREEFRRCLLVDPKQALAMVEGLVLFMHVETGYATQAARGSGVSWREIGRAMALVDDAGILLRQAAALFLGLPAADRAAEREMVAQALAEQREYEEDEAAELLGEPRDREPDVWAAAVDRFRRGVHGQAL
ncbi:hypothetical protein OG453_44780 [Streptomyces sp. NBC_01381]|uniref:hypothetical protein n=1 Tax=Streptomyces sp. NBC_01381 TaxID=2903845 RepID=UPI00225AB2D5|nr:hypothetical protein [Streptomyces sp. NBC_01381]MCX4673675.1 hypothetical protein [Streptomyces sp. NBC_01381]